MIYDWRVPVLILGLVFSLGMLVLTLIAIALWIKEQFPIKYIIVKPTLIDEIDEFQEQIYEWMNDDNEQR